MNDPRIFDADAAPDHCPRCHVLIFVDGLGSMVDVAGAELLSRYRCKVCGEVWYLRIPPDTILLGAPEHQNLGRE